MNIDWPKFRLGDVIEKAGSGSTPKGGQAVYRNHGIPLIRSMNVVFFGFKSEGLVYLDDHQAAALSNAMVASGDVLLNITGASIGRVTLAPEALNGARVNQHVCIIRPTAAIDPRFLNAFLSSPEMQTQIWADNYGVTRQALTKQQVLDFEVPLPPFAEQQRIADKLDTVLARVDACRERLAHVAPLLKRFRESVLGTATSGRLTADWRICNKTNDLSQMTTVRIKANTAAIEEWLLAVPQSWGVLRASEVVEPGAEIVYGIVQPGPKLAEGVPYVRGMDIANGKIQVQQLLRTSPAIAERYARASIRGGDVLLGIIRATKVAIVPDVLDGANITQGTARLRPSTHVLPRYLASVLEAPATQRWLHAHYRGIDMPGLNLADVRRTPIPVPPMEEQAEIVRRVETLFAYADRLEARLTAAQSAVDRLTPALLAKAFRGELVPQDPADEPATELLKRLQAQTSQGPQRVTPKRSRPAQEASA